MRNKIWYDMVHAKFGEIYLAKYIHRQRTARKIYKVLILLFSTSGIFGWGIWSYYPVVACILIAIMQLFSLVENQIVISDKDLESIGALRNLYINYGNKLENLWVEFESGRLAEDLAIKNFYTLRQLKEEIEATDNKLHINRIKDVCNKADVEAREYFNHYHS